MSSGKLDVARARLVNESFDEKLPRRTAILMKGEDFSLSFAYSSEFSSIGWLLDNREETTHEETPVATLNRRNSFQDLSGKRLAKNKFYFKAMEYQYFLSRGKIVFSAC
jgi:hypothetical protein